jgi:flagellar hook protein FlgE
LPVALGDTRAGAAVDKQHGQTVGVAALLKVELVAVANCQPLASIGAYSWKQTTHTGTLAAAVNGE